MRLENKLDFELIRFTEKLMERNVSDLLDLGFEYTPFKRYYDDGEITVGLSRGQMDQDQRTFVMLGNDCGWDFSVYLSGLGPIRDTVSGIGGVDIGQLIKVYVNGFGLVNLGAPPVGVEDLEPALFDIDKLRSYEVTETEREKYARIFGEVEK